jgi:translation elongation factor P/translation initiation factor 5A
VRDENTRVKLKESNDDFIADKVVKKTVSLSESTMADSQFMDLKDYNSETQGEKGHQRTACQKEKNER